MTEEDLLHSRLAGQHLLMETDTLAAAGDLCGVQAQFLSAATHALRIRTGSADVTGLVKSWTLRGTVHLFPEQDFPLYIHQRGTPEDVCDSPWYRWMSSRGDALPEERERYFARVITESIREGHDTREALRDRCRACHMTEAEEARVFHSWGGTIAELAQLGVICFKVQSEKAYRLCPDFVPVAEDAAKKELARRYFTHYGPATLRDAAYFFRVTQAEVKKWLDALPVQTVLVGGKTHFFIPHAGEERTAPSCLLLAGFDPLMLGYRKEDNPFLPAEYLRRIFSLAGIVQPGILLHGRIVGKWRPSARRTELTIFDETLAEEEKRLISQTAETLFPEKQAVLVQAD